MTALVAIPSSVGLTRTCGVSPSPSPLNAGLASQRLLSPSDTISFPGLELDVADAERLARHDGLGEPVRVLDELVLPNDWRLAVGLPRHHRGLDIRVIRADELARRRRRLRRPVAGRLDHGNRTRQVLRDRLGPIQRGASDHGQRPAAEGDETHGEMESASRAHTTLLP